jgi:hypothetical protein
MDLTQTAQALDISKPGVLDAVKRGALKRQADKSFSPADIEAYRAARQGERGPKPPGRPRSVKPLSDDDLPVETAALAATLRPGGVFANRGEAELARDSYTAHLRELQFKRENGELVGMEGIKLAIAAAAASCKGRLLAIPAERAAQLSRLRTPAQVEDALREAITEALDVLTEGLAKAA